MVQKAGYVITSIRIEKFYPLWNSPIAVIGIAIIIAVLVEIILINIWWKIQKHLHIMDEWICDWCLGLNIHRQEFDGKSLILWGIEKKNCWRLLGLFTYYVTLERGRGGTAKRDGSKKFGSNSPLFARRGGGRNMWTAPLVYFRSFQKKLKKCFFEWFKQR